MRQTLLLLHKYAGLVLGLVLSVIGISGSLIVFDRELDELIAPHTADFEPAASLASIDLALANATREVGNGSKATRIQLGRHAGAPHIARFPGPPDAPGSIEVTINPGNAEVTAVRTWGEYTVTWFYYLHYALLAGEAGHIFVGVMGIVMLFFCISGVVIWWPRLGGWRRAFTMKRGLGAFRLNLDLHKLIGIYSLLIFLLLSVTGIEIVFPQPVEATVDSLFAVEEFPNPEVEVPAAASPLSVDAIMAVAQSALPESQMYRIYLPGADSVPYRLSFIHPEEIWTEYGASTVWVDQYNGEVITVWDSRSIPLGNKILSWFFPLHNGDALGIVGRWLIFISGFLPAILFGTGLYMWLHKRRITKRSAG
ncbi:MAG: hypothetical protein CMQ38_00340 [Gammaproteobacteria bacterium]|nr:hypothetical protein [Gammaproteobacteria bacterium]